MIAYVSTAKYVNVLGSFLTTWGRPVRRRVIQFDYESIFSIESLPQATYIFSDLDRISPAVLEQAGTLAANLSARGDRVLNPPLRYVPRLSYLKLLSEAGINPYRAFGIEELPVDIRFPVFVRRANDHDGPRSPLLQDRSALDRVVAQALEAGVIREELMVVEYEDVRSPDGLYRKYSYWNFGGRLMPRHLVYSQGWIVKAPSRAARDKVTPAQVEEELTFLQSSPKQAEVLRAFDLAGLDYGRIDYSVKDGRIVIWEVNSNPIPITPPSDVLAERAPVDQLVARRLIEEFLALDQAASKQP